MSLADQSCDAMVLNHVLDCMPDDRSAVREMFRILRPGGVALAVVAFESGTTSREIPAASNKLYRVYGSEDAAVRFAPFRVDLADAAAGLSAETRRLQGIPATVPVVVMRKPADGRPAA